MDECNGGVCVGGPPPAEICNNGLDDDCDGLTDSADPDCIAVEPIVFVHGWCGDATGWEPMIEALQALDPGTYGSPGSAALLYYDYRPRFKAIIPERYSPDTRIVALELTNSACQKSVCDFHQLGDEIEVAQTSIRDKAFQLKEAIAFVKQRSGAAKVIVVGHSQGGLVARAYVQGLATKDASIPDETTPYENDVERIVTIDTPHAGAPLAKINWNRFPACFAVDTVSKQEMSVPTAGCPANSTRPECFLHQLNSASLPTGLRLVSIASRSLLLGYPYFSASDDIVGYWSQDLKTPVDLRTPFLRRQDLETPLLSFRNDPRVLGQDNPTLAIAPDPLIHTSVVHDPLTYQLVDRDIRYRPITLRVEDVLVSAGGFPFDPTVAEFRIRLSEPVDGDIEVEFETCNTVERCPKDPEDSKDSKLDYARARVDFLPDHARARIPAGTTEKLVPITVFRQRMGRNKVFYLHVFFPVFASVERALGKATLLRSNP